MKSVLIITDDKELAIALKTDLCSNQFTFNTLPGNENVIEELIKFQPDLILIDFLLHNANGGSLCREIRGYYELQQLPLVLLTDYPNIERFMAKFSCNAIIRKPVMVQELANTLGRMLEHAAIAPFILEQAS